jgi:hypothetical protein
MVNGKKLIGKWGNKEKETFTFIKYYLSPKSFEKHL